MIRVNFNHPLVFIQEGLVAEAIFIDCLYIESHEDNCLKMYTHPSEQPVITSFLNVKNIKPQPCI